MKEDLKAIVLDGMGVIYTAGDDVKELLIPFILEKGGCADEPKIQSLYISTSLGQMTSAEYWKALDVNPALEDEYLQRHTLREGILDLLNEVRKEKIPLWGLFNDIAEWSKKLRTRFCVEKYFVDFIVSGEVHLRKPDPAIYRLLAGKLAVNPAEVLVVDDMPRNLDAAEAVGFRTILLISTNSDLSKNHHRTAGSIKELQGLI
jgi:HAD superfamily hydrolase (TIGR01509 family)